MRLGAPAAQGPGGGLGQAEVPPEPGNDATVAAVDQPGARIGGELVAHLSSGPSSQHCGWIGLGARKQLQPCTYRWDSLGLGQGVADQLREW
jgi:hypothetical protein